MNIIPNQFNLAGLTVTVEFDSTLCQTKNMLGEARYTDQKIVLDPTAAAPETITASFYHELVHWCLYIMNEEELRNSERFVDLMAHLLYQANKTSVYCEPVLPIDDTPFLDDDIPF